MSSTPRRARRFRPQSWALLPSLTRVLPVLAGAALTPSAASADTINLLTYGSSGQSQGAYFFQSNPQPTGTGVFDPFVRIQQTGTERGYNTDGRPVEFQTKDENQWTHSLALSSLQSVTFNGISYYQFTLDINEQGNTTGSLLSMDDFRLYLGDSPSLLGWNDGFGADSVKVYDIDKAGDTTVNLNYRLNSGSGSGDMTVYVPTSYFAGYPSQFSWVYLYSSFGNPYASDAGFEEWSALTGKGSPSSPPPPPPPPPGAVPAPPGAVLGLLGIGGALFGRGFRRRVTEVTGKPETE